MKPRNQIFSALAVAVALCGAVYADPSSVNGPHRGGMHGQHQPSAATLGLTGDLATQWDALNAQEKALHRQRFADGAGVLNDAVSQLSSPNVDLAALAKQKDAREDSERSQQRAIRDQRLALYKSMPATAKTAVRTVMLQRLTTMQERVSKMQDRAAAHAAAATAQ